MKVRVRSTVATMILLAACIPAFSAAAKAQSYKVLYRFTGGADGGNPYSGVVRDASGNLYGTTGDGANPGCVLGQGCGTVFELSPGSAGWADATLLTFNGSSGGGNPIDSLTFDKKGNLYGTTEVGGLQNCAPYGCGVVFKLGPGSGSWSETIIHRFNGADGDNAIAGLARDKEGRLYSTTVNGGDGNGTVFELFRGRLGWKRELLFSFTCNFQSSTGSEPEAAPTLDHAGNLYGTTPLCGAGNDGTVYELVRGKHGGWTEKTIYAFTGLDGNKPLGGLVFDKAGNLYGTTEIGGKYDYGVVFKLALLARGKWKETVLYSFKGGNDGAFPFSTLRFDQAGSLCGTTHSGGRSGWGTVFKLAPTAGGRWKETILHHFAGGAGGATPFYGALAVDAGGNLYGTTVAGGQGNCLNGAGCGVVYEITP